MQFNLEVDEEVDEKDVQTNLSPTANEEDDAQSPQNDCSHDEPTHKSSPRSKSFSLSNSHLQKSNPTEPQFTMAYSYNTSVSWNNQRTILEKVEETLSKSKEKVTKESLLAPSKFAL